METLKIFDEEYNEQGRMDRDEVHRLGQWHETFQCLIYDDHFIYFQRRAHDKQDFPDLLDISVGGHVAADETIEQAKREVHEELGIDAVLEEIKFSRVIKTETELDDFHDKEFVNLHLYHISDDELQTIHFTDDEVADLVAFEKHLLMALFSLEIDEIEGVSVMDGQDMVVRMEDFVPHPTHYYQQLANIMKTV